MNRETLIHISENISMPEMKKLEPKICADCGGQKPTRQSKNPHMMFVSYDDEKIKISQIPAVAMHHGLRATVIDF